MGREEISTLKTVGSILIKMIFQKRWSFHKIKIKKEKKEKKEKRKRKKDCYCCTSRCNYFCYFNFQHNIGVNAIQIMHGKFANHYIDFLPGLDMQKSCIISNVKAYKKL